MLYIIFVSILININMHTATALFIFSDTSKSN